MKMDWMLDAPEEMAECACDKYGPCDACKEQAAYEMAQYLEERGEAGIVIEMQACIPREPPAGSWASIARVMSRECPDFDWDAWKDEMKEGGGW
jgi:hypothetical protein